MKLVKTVLVSLLLLVPATSQPFQGVSEKTKKYLKAALYGAAAATSGYLVYCCVRELCSAKRPDNLTIVNLPNTTMKAIDECALECALSFDKNKILSTKESIKEVVLLETCLNSLNTKKLFAQIDTVIERETTSDKILSAALKRVGSIAKIHIKEQTSFYSTKDILGVLVGCYATFHLSNKAISYLKDGDLLDVSFRPQVNNGTVQSSMSVGFTINR